MHPRIVIARPQRGRGALSAQREEVPLGCNLGKALTARTNHRRPHALPNLTVAAVSDRLVQSHSTAGGHWCTAALPDVSLRGAKRRGNLAVHSWITGRPRRKRNCLPEIAPQGHFLALRAQGATSACGLLAMTSRGLLPFYRQPVRIGSIAPGPAVRSPTVAGTILTAAGMGSAVRRRARLSAPLQRAADPQNRSSMASR